MSDERDVWIEIRRRDGRQLELRVRSGDGATRWELLPRDLRALAAARRLRQSPHDRRRRDAARAAMRRLLDSTPLARARLAALCTKHLDRELDPPRLIVQVAGHEADATAIRAEARDTARVAHESLFELVDLDGRFILCAEDWPILRHVPAPAHASARAPRPAEPRLLVVVGSQVQAARAESTRAELNAFLAKLDQLQGLAGFTLAVARSEAAPFAGRNRTIELTEVEHLLALLRGKGERPPFDVVLFLGHSFEDSGATRASKEATALDLGLPREEPLPPGPSFAELALALAHGRTSVLAFYACNQGPSGPLALLDAVEHCVVTAARIRPLWAAKSAFAFLEQLFRYRVAVEEAVRVARGPFDDDGAIARWWLQHWASTLERRPIHDPLREGLARFLDRACAQVRLELQGTLLEGRHGGAGKLVELTIEEQIERHGSGDAGEAAEKAEHLGLRRRTRAAGGEQLMDLLEEQRRSGDPKRRRFVVLAGPGAGKTVMLLRTRQLLAESQALVPVFVRLRRWTQDCPLLQLVTPAGADPEGRQRQALTDLHARGRLVYLLDGLDEVPRAERAALFDRVHALTQDPGNLVVVTSRPIDYEPLEGFTPLGLRPLDDDERERLIELRLGTHHPQLASIRLTIARRAAGSPSFQRLCGNPLFLTLVADLLASGRAAGGKQHELLGEMLEYLLDQLHRQESDREPYADRDAASALLADLAGQMTRTLRAEFDEAELDEWSGSESARALRGRLETSKDWKRGQRPLEWLRDCARRTGLLLRTEDDSGQSSWQFRHRALQEYLGAVALKSLHDEQGEDAVLEIARRRPEGSESREHANFWAEPFALLAGMIAPESGNAWILRLLADEGTRPVALRAALNASALDEETLRSLLHRLARWEDRVQVYETLLERPPRARAAPLLRRLAAEERDGNVLWHADQVLAQLDPAHGAIAEELRTELLAHMPPPPAELFTWVPGHESEFAWKRIPAGRFVMGSPESEPGHHEDEDQVEVEITRPYWVLATACTLEMFRAFAPHHRQTSDAPHLPAVGVTWFEASMACRWLTHHRELLIARLAAQEPGNGLRARDLVFRLPTEAEWERACRAGESAAFWCGAELSEDCAWFGKNSGDRLQQVAQRRASPWGLYDMHGNCWEWCGDWYAGRLRQGADPIGPGRGSDRVLRGGSFWSGAGLCRSAFRNRSGPAFRVHFFGGVDYAGFRPVLAAPLPSSVGLLEDR
jgi:formylglycine-generating enzyme required for sulfatase activity